MAQRGAEGDAGLTQSLGEKMAAVVARYGKERPNARPCVLCGTEVADPLMAGHLAMHEQAQQCGRCRSAAKLDEHLAHVHAAIRECEAAQAESFRVVPHPHGEPTPEQRVVGEAVRAVITAELDGTALETLAARLYAKQAELAYFFGYGGGVWTEPVAWDELPARYQAWIVATVNELIKDGSIRCG